jgi:AraC-like DNA-binding protein
MACYLDNRLVFQSAQFSITNVCCRAKTSELSPVEYTTRPCIVFVRRGVFRKHMGREEVLADANHVIFLNRGDEHRISHPVPGGDDCTSLTYNPKVIESFCDESASRGSGDRPFPFTHVLCTSACMLRLHRLLKRIELHRADAFEVHEEGLAVLDAIGVESRKRNPGRVGRRMGTQARHRRLVDAARELIAADPGADHTLQEIGQAVGSSPYHLVRVFRAQTGMPLHRYRNQLRLRLALERIAQQGNRDLTAIALELGYSSHSHFTEAFRREYHVSPSAFRLN